MGNEVLRKSQVSNGRYPGRLCYLAEDTDANTTETCYLDHAFVHLRSSILDVATRAVFVTALLSDACCDKWHDVLLMRISAACSTCFSTSSSSSELQPAGSADDSVKVLQQSDTWPYGHG